MAPNQIWIGDITYIALANSGFLYLALWMDLYSRKIIGCGPLIAQDGLGPLDDNMKEELVTSGFKKA
jgi:transposase InsO family protein